MVADENVLGWLVANIGALIVAGNRVLPSQTQRAL